MRQVESLVCLPFEMVVPSEVLTGIVMQIE